MSSDAIDTRLVVGSLSRNLVRLSGPVIASHLIQYLFEVVDLAWIGHLPHAETALAALTVCTFIAWLMEGVIGLITIGATTLVARHIGAGQTDRARQAASEVLSFGLPFGILVAALGLATMDILCDHLGLSAQVALETKSYLRLLYPSFLLSFWIWAFSAGQQGAGDTVTPFKIGLLAFGLNVGLDPLLIYGLGPIPAFGLEGAAMASLTAKATAILAFTWLARRGRLLIDPATIRFRLRPSTIAACARIGWPIALLGIVFMAIHLELVKIIAPFGAAAIAALGIGGRIEGVTYVTAQGIGIATQTMVSQNLGANQPQRAQRSAWLAMALASGVGLVVGTLLLFFPALLVRPLASGASPQAIREAMTYCRVVSFTQLFMSWELIMTGAFAGVGYTLPAMLNSVPITLSRIPFAHYLVRLGLGSTGVYWAIALTCALRGIVAVVWFRFGRWRRRYLGRSPA
ncbi:MAG: MATE family efflux transporter [Bradymonadales bacterium]|nr:MATE family efflux transporter [Bradymonadales bacterium]